MTKPPIVHPFAMVACLGVLALSGLALGAVLLIRSVLAASRSLRALRWRRVEGSVEHSNVASLSALRARTPVSTSFHRPEIVYCYKVGGAVYRARRIRFMEIGYGDPDAARRRLERVINGDAVTVYYDPTDPSSAVLDRRISGPVFAVAAIGLFFLALPMGAAAALFTMLRSGELHL